MFSKSELDQSKDTIVIIKRFPKNRSKLNQNEFIIDEYFKENNNAIRVKYSVLVIRFL